MIKRIKICAIVFSVILCISTNSFSQIKIKGESNKIVMGQDRIDDSTEDQYNILSASVFGKEGFYRAGSKLAFGDFGRWDRWGWNAFIGEWGPTDTDQLWLHGKKGFVLTYGRAGEDYYIMWFDANTDRRLHIETEVLVQGVKIPANEEDQQDPDIITNPLDRLHHLDGITYKHNFFRIKSRGDNVASSTEEISDKERADEEFFSELVETDKDGNNYIDYTGLIPVLVEGMKEQSRVLKAQSLKIKEMGLLAGDMTLMNDSTDSSFATKGKFDSDTASDIFGTMIEFSIEGYTGDYEMMEDVAIDPSLKRSLQFPKNFGDPNTYQGQNWYYGTDVSTAEHTNNGVQNYWFYLLAEGGNGYNDNGDYYSVQGIGKDKAAKIAYRNLTSYLISSSIYSSARAGSIWAAVDLYGECSFEVQQVINSWNAVGVYGLQYSDPLNYCGDIYNHPINPIRSFHPMIFAPNGCSTTVKNGSNVRFVSASYIELQSGFEVEAGASFEANVYECNMINN